MGRSSIGDVIHGCELTVLACVDFRLHGYGGLDEYLRDQFDSDVKYDLVTRAGGVYRFLHGPPEARSEVLFDLQTSIGHAPERLLIVQHTDCAVYNQNRCFENTTEELKMLIFDALAAARILAKTFPTLAFEIAVLKIEDGRIKSQIYRRNLAGPAKGPRADLEIA
jgi:hypothetical protein